MAFLDELNPQQKEAVLQTEGPVLVLAGAGTGKTRVITYRIAYLIEQGVRPSSILAVTFTNKAAEEMKHRIDDLLRASGRSASDLWVSTFHSFCARLLRIEASRLELPRDFAIYDDSDQTEAVKLAMAELELGDRTYPPRQMLSRISYAKNDGIDPEGMAAEAFDDMGRDAAAVYRAYQAILKKANALDFDDLLLRAVELLKQHPEARTRWSGRFQYILVDEFQDTNRWQEDLIKLLAGARHNVCVVGDEDQSIYSWRGAKAGNFRRFLDDFPSARTFRLEENYRSTQTILDASGGLVARNSKRLGKTLRATRDAGAAIRFFEAQDANTEAEFVCGEIVGLVRADPTIHIAVLYRTTAQSRAFEETLRRLGIRYRVVGGVSFYKRQEVKVALSYLRLVLQPDDDVALLRVLNTPPRGIGKATVEALRSEAQARGLSLWDALDTAANSSAVKSGRALKAFRRLIEDLQKNVAEFPPAEMLRRILDRTSYLDWIEEQDKLERSSHADNLRELVNAIAETTEQGETVDAMLDQAALVGDTDEYDQDVTVSLMTLHSAKGLEFDAVFLVGLEEGLLPHSRSAKRDDDIEEERRLCYVGMTRARHSLTLSRAQYRRTYGEERLRASTPSRFLREIPGELVEIVVGSLAEAGEARRYESDSDHVAGRSFRGRAPVRSAGAHRAESPKNSLIGTRVRHPTLGIGTILSVEGEPDDRTITVSFLDYGTKKIKERYAHLELA
ncbi:MAG: UvrD-helicase domain-containing protein [Candidatus Acidiferrales bacterium]